MSLLSMHNTGNFPLHGYVQTQSNYCYYHFQHLFKHPGHFSGLTESIAQLFPLLYLMKYVLESWVGPGAVTWQVSYHLEPLASHMGDDLIPDYSISNPCDGVWQGRSCVHVEARKKCLALVKPSSFCFGCLRNEPADQRSQYLLFLSLSFVPLPYKETSPKQVGQFI